METIYVEQAIRDHPRVHRILSAHPRATVVECARYGEVFNVRAQNFRIQKQNPALILAEKKGKTVLPTPPGYTIGRSENYYFSHFLNCLYDCRYCFLQGMYRSASYVHFVNLEDFTEGINAVGGPDSCFFSGYDCDSLAMESLTGFAAEMIPFFSGRPDWWLELRTKSINTAVLEKADPVPNIITAYTLTPAEIAQEIEHGAPSYERRLNRVKSLTQQGWMVGLRLDPLIPWPDFESLYGTMIDEVFVSIDAEKIHSVTLGPMRFPKAMHDRIIRLYPYDPLFALKEMTLQNGQMTYPTELEEALTSTVSEQLQRYLPGERIFRQT